MAINTKERAARWKCSIRVMQKLIKAKVPVHSDLEMGRWYGGLSPDQQEKMTPSMRAEIVAVGGGSTKPDKDHKEFTALYSEEAGEKTVLADLKRQLAFFLFRHKKAAKDNDGVKVSEALRQIKELASIVHDTEIRAHKLGRDMGDLVPRADLERPARFLAYHLLRCADAALAKLAKAIAERDPKLPAITAPEIRSLGEPLFLTALVFEPMERAMAGDNGAAPPEWLMKAMKEGMSEVVE